MYGIEMYRPEQRGSLTLLAKKGGVMERKYRLRGFFSMTQLLTGDAYPLIGLEFHY